MQEQNLVFLNKTTTMTGVPGMSCIHPLKDMNENVKEKRKKQKKVCYLGKICLRLLSAYFS